MLPRRILTRRIPSCKPLKTTTASFSRLRCMSTQAPSTPGSQQDLKANVSALELNAATFDTLAFVERLKGAGFTQQQAEVVMTSMRDVIEESMSELKHTMVSKDQQGKTVHAYRLDFAHLKSEIHLLEKNDFAILKQDNERIVSEVEKLKQKMREDLQRMQAGVRLDMNLDKARVRDEQSVVQLKIKETETKLEQEVVQLRANIDTVKMDTIKTIGAAATSIGFLILGWARYFKS